MQPAPDAKNRPRQPVQHGLAEKQPGELATRHTDARRMG